jgi:hypothetical protein
LVSKNHEDVSGLDQTYDEYDMPSDEYSSPVNFRDKDTQSRENHEIYNSPKAPEFGYSQPTSS